MSAYLAWGLSFVVGFAIMVLELTASRAMAPILGSSLYTWTAVIGTVLTGLSIGAYGGGKVIDQHPHIGMLRHSLFLSGGAVCLMVLLVPVVPTLVLLPLSVPFLATLVSFLLFFIPSTLLGAIQPMIVKLSSTGIDHLGRSYGTLSALWSLGSIVGVFCSGFSLIPLLGTEKTFFLVAGTLFASGIILSKRRLPALSILAVLLMFSWFFSLPNGPHVLFSKDTGYFRALVAEAELNTFGTSRIFFLDLDTHSIQRGTSTVPVYTDITRLFSRGVSSTSDILVIGGGAYTMPNDLASGTDATVAVAELDPDVPPIVKKYFSINPKIATHIGDARVLLRKNDHAYDIIFGDSFNSYLSVPWHLLTKEFNDNVTRHLKKDGVYGVNIISTIDGAGNALYRSVDRTLRESFPFVETYAFNAHHTEIQNIIFLASHAPLDRWKNIGESTSIVPGGKDTFEDWRLKTVPEGGLLLTDDHAPTDTMLLPIARRALPFSTRLYYSMIH